MKVERELFFPWLQTLLPSSSKYLFNDVYEKHDKIKKISGSLRNTCMSLSGNNDNNYKVALGLLNELKDCALFIQNVQEKVFVPFISAYVTKKDQEKFNNKVIRNLGLLESQVHIVSMKEAIDGNMKEEKLFKNQIPFVAQKLLPVWRKRLYMPRAKCLDSSRHDIASMNLEGGFIEEDDDDADAFDTYRGGDGDGDGSAYSVMQTVEKEFISKYFPDSTSEE